jgi:hypothetical protein
VVVGVEIFEGVRDFCEGGGIGGNEGFGVVQRFQGLESVFLFCEGARLIDEFDPGWADGEGAEAGGDEEGAGGD